MEGPTKTARVKNGSNQLKLDLNEQWMNRMHKLRRNFTIKSKFSAATYSEVPPVNKMLYTWIWVLKYKIFPSNQP